MRIHLHLFQHAFTCLCMHAHNLRVFGFPHNRLNVYMILHSHLRLQSHSHRCACARMLAHVFCSSMPLYAYYCTHKGSVHAGCKHALRTHRLWHALACTYAVMRVPWHTCFCLCLSVFMFTPEHTLANIAFSCPHAYVSFECIFMSVHASCITNTCAHTFF